MESSRAAKLTAVGGEGTDLERLKCITTTIVSGEPAGIVLQQILETIATLCGGKRAVLCVQPDEMAAIVGDAASEGEVALSDRAFLVSSGQLADEIRDWEGSAQPWASSDGNRLIFPLAAGGVLVCQPGANAAGVADRALAVQLAVDLAAIEAQGAKRFDEAKQRARALQETRARLRQQNTLLRELAVSDELTGLHNRRFFDTRLTYEIERFARYRSSLSLVLIDIDHFKSVNDTHGHQMGDLVLKHVAALAQQTFRRVDLVARYGGEEFAALLPETGVDGALIAGERFCSCLRSACFEHGELKIQITASVGIATAEGNWDGDAARLTQAADEALYEAKRAGRDRVVLAPRITPPISSRP